MKIKKGRSLFYTIFFLLFLLMSFTSYAQTMSPEEVVQKQLETYNNRDIEGFMSLIHPEVEFYEFSTRKKTLEGAAACKELYAKLFENSPNLHSDILTRTVFDNKVIDHESITGRNGNEEVLELVLIYEVKDEKIIEITVLRKEE